MNLKCIKNITLFVSLAISGACSQNDIPDSPAGGTTEDGNSFVVEASLNVSGIRMTGTRAMGQTPDYASLKLYAVEFECANAENPAENVISNIYDSGDEITEETYDNADLVTFKIRLNKTESPRVIHLIALPATSDLEIGYGTEAYVIPQLTTSGSSDAYWKRIVFPQGYGIQNEDVWETLPEVNDKFTRVPMLRNFAQVSVENNATSFELTGFALINVPDMGSVAPWNYSEGVFSGFLDTSGSMKTYQEISGKDGEGYVGFLPAGSSLTDLSPEGMTYDLTPKFLYERPFPQNNLDRTYVIVKGRYGNDSADTYYKVDLGNLDSDSGIFNYYDLLRNFDYHVTINSVGTSGYPDPAQAASGVVYNNFSFDVDTRSLTNISNGSEILFVNFTSAVITQDSQTDIEFKYRYRDVGASTGSNNGEISLIGLENGDVIESVTTDTQDDAAGWRTVRIKTYAPSNEMKTQEFVIVDPSTGLGRTINLILRNPWQLLNPEEFAGRYTSTYPDADNQELRRGKAGYSQGRYLTVFFNLPDELPEAMFPLTFTVESDRQDIENDPVGNLLVTSGESMFVEGATRIQYEKTVTWRQYNDEKTTEEPNNTIVFENGRAIHRVRCRFLTITSIPSGTLTTNVRIRNPYFNDITVSFERVYNINFPEVE